MISSDKLINSLRASSRALNLMGVHIVFYCSLTIAAPYTNARTTLAREDALRITIFPGRCGGWKCRGAGIYGDLDGALLFI